MFVNFFIKLTLNLISINIKMLSNSQPSGKSFFLAKEEPIFYRHLSQQFEISNHQYQSQLNFCLNRQSKRLDSFLHWFLRALFHICFFKIANSSKHIPAGRLNNFENFTAKSFSLRVSDAGDFIRVSI